MLEKAEEVECGTKGGKEESKEEHARQKKKEGKEILNVDNILTIIIIVLIFIAVVCELLQARSIKKESAKWLDDQRGCLVFILLVACAVLCCELMKGFLFVLFCCLFVELCCE